MPRLKREKKNRYVMGVRVMNAAIDIEDWREFWGGDDEGRAAWEALKHERFTANPGTRAAPFWAYEPHVPEELRALAFCDAPESLDAQGAQWLNDPPLGG